MSPVGPTATRQPVLPSPGAAAGFGWRARVSGILRDICSRTPPQPHLRFVCAKSKARGAADRETPRSPACAGLAYLKAAQAAFVAGGPQARPHWPR